MKTLFLFLKHLLAKYQLLHKTMETYRYLFTSLHISGRKMGMFINSVR